MPSRRHRGLSYLPPAPTRTPILLYLVVAALFLGGIFYAKSLLVRPITGKVVDAYTGKPIVNAGVTLENDARLAHSAGVPQILTTTTSLDGSFLFEKGTGSFYITAASNPYRPNKLQPDKSEGIEIRLVPRNLRGLVKDNQNKPVARASVTLSDRSVMTDSDGFYIIEDAPEEGQLVVKAAGYRSAALNYSKTSGLDVTLTPQVNHGIYLKASSVADPNSLNEIIKAAGSTEINTLVIDLKDSNGLTFYDSKVPLSRPAPENKGKIADLPGTLKMLREKGFYTVARISVFQDASLTDVKPELGLKSRSTGRLWADSARFNWANPYLKEVWNYNIGLASEAAKAGFDEIQFAYVQFPQVGNLADIEYGQTNNTNTRIGAITGFLKEANSQLNKLGVFVSAEVLGQSVLEEGDLGIGQDITMVADLVDYVSPVLFPSYFGTGTFNFDKPALQPLEVIKRCITFARTKLDGKRAQLRPWLQDFSAEGVTYGSGEVRAEIQGFNDATSSSKLSLGWLLWNGQSKYTYSAVKPKS